MQIFKNSAEGRDAAAGVQWAELNAFTPARLYQNVCMVQGEVVNWRLSHAGRLSTPERMRFNIGTSPSGSGSQVIVDVTTNTAGAGTINSCGLGTCGVSSNVNAWANYSGSFTWSGSSGMQTIGFQAVESSALSAGNLLDNIQVTLTPFVEFSAATGSGLESIASANTPGIKVSGSFPTPTSITVNVTGGTAILGTDYTTPNGAATFTVTIPMGDYAGQVFPLGVAVISEALREADETITFALSASPASYTIAGTQTCGAPAIASSAYTIVNDDFIADLAITKDDGATTYTPGFDVTYSIVVTNNGPDVVTSAQVSDPLPVDITNASWVCAATGGGVCGAASGTGAITTTANLPVAASVTYTLSMTVPGNYSGDLVNTATVTAPAGVTDTNPDNNTANDTDTMESPPVSTACSPRSVTPAMSFTLVPLAPTGTTQRSGAANGWNPDNPWSTLGGDYTIGWTFSPAIQAEWIQFGIVNVADATVGATFTVSLGAGSTATVNQIVVISGPFTHDGAGVIRRNAPTGTQVNGVFGFNTTGTITSLTVTTNGVPSNDNIANSLFVRPACLTVQKVSEGDTGSFTINLSNTVQVDGTAVPSTTLTTATPGTPVSSPGYFSRTIGTGMSLSEVVPAGWGITSAACTDQNAGNTGNPTVISAFVSPTLTIPADNVRPEADILCRFNNGQLPRINLTKTTRRMAGGPFGFTLGNTTVASPAAVTTLAADDPVAVDGDAGADTAFTISSFGADVTIDESSLPADWIVDASTTCTNTGGAVVGGLSNRIYTIPAGSVAVGETYACNFVNAPTTNLRIDKAVTPTAARAGDTVTYTIAVNNDGPGPGDGAVVADPPVTGVDCAAATLSCSAGGGAVCPASLDVTTLQSTGLTIPTFPAGGSLQFGMACTVTATGL